MPGSPGPDLGKVKKLAVLLTTFHGDQDDGDNGRWMVCQGTESRKVV